MKIIVQKFGGSSLRNIRCIERAAQRVAAKREQGLSVVVVVSAMGDTTDQLLELARQAAASTPRRELDFLLATGEAQSAALLSMSLQSLGAPAVALCGRQCGIQTNSVHMNARILEIRPDRILQELEAGRIVVATGFQGVSASDDLTTLGRGGSDLTAIALAAAVGAEYCEILTDVDGVFDADPRVIAGARRIGRTTHRFLQTFAAHGARVLKGEAVDFASDHGIALRVLSSTGEGRGTQVEVADDRSSAAAARTQFSSRSAYSGIAGRKDLIRLAMATPSLAAWRKLSAVIAPYDLVAGRVGSQCRQSTWYLSTEEIPDLDAFVDALHQHCGTEVPEISEVLGAVTLVGFGLGSRPAALFEAIDLLQRAEITVLDSYTGRESLSLVVAQGAVDAGMRLLYSHYLSDRFLQRQRPGGSPPRPAVAQPAAGR